jgi:hypothetical protein
LWYALDVLQPANQTPPGHMPKHIEGAPGVPRRAKRARGSALGHPGRGHVEMRGVPAIRPGPSGCGARDPVSALPAIGWGPYYNWMRKRRSGRRAAPTRLCFLQFKK